MPQPIQPPTYPTPMVESDMLFKTVAHENGQKVYANNS